MSKNKTNNLIIRYIVLIFGLFIMASGVAFSAKSNLGVSPISSIPYVVSMITDFTIGELTAICNTILLLLQIILLRSNFPKEQILQFPIGILFGYLIDFNMFLIATYTPSSYTSQWIMCLLSFILLGFGVFCEVKAGVVMLPGEGFVNAITKVKENKFSNNKIIVDSSMVLMAVIISFIYFSELHGVREGTIAAALAVGFFASIFLKRVKIFDRHLAEKASTKTA